MPVDRNGQAVKVGSRVKVLGIDSCALVGLSEKEALDVTSMRGEVFEVYEIDEHDSAWVEKWWDRADGGKECHSLPLSSSEMELVE